MEVPTSDRLLRLVVLLNKHSVLAKDLAHLVEQEEFDGLARALLNMTIPTGSTLLLIRALMAGEFEKHFRDPSSIMRSNCIASKLVGLWSRLRCQGYLVACVGDLVLKIIDDDSLSLEIDPRKLESEEQGVKNQATLMEITGKIFAAITSEHSLSIMPREIRAIAAAIAELAKTYAADRLLPLVGGFIMLRLLNPFLVTPETYGLQNQGTPVTLTPKARRNMTLITKLLQNLSNNILFGTKEHYMVTMNPFLDAHREAMDGFLTTLCEDPLAIDKVPWADCFSPPAVDDLDANKFDMKDITLVHRLLYAYKDKLIVKLSSIQRDEEDLTEIDEVFHILYELGPPGNLRPTTKTAENQIESSTLLSPPIKSGHVLKPSTNILIPKTKWWVVLTEYFFHYFSSPLDSKPSKSIAVDSLVVVDPRNETQLTSAASSNQYESSFQLLTSYNTKAHVIICTSTHERDDWIATIRSVKERRKSPNPKKEQIGAFETRMKNYIMGKRINYECGIVGFDADVEDIVFIFELTAFQTKWTVIRPYRSILDFHEKLVSGNPQMIFPVFSKELDMRNISSARGLLQRLGMSLDAVLSRPGFSSIRAKRTLRGNIIPLTTSPANTTSTTATSATPTGGSLIIPASKPAHATSSTPSVLLNLPPLSFSGPQPTRKDQQLPYAASAPSPVEMGQSPSSSSHTAKLNDFLAATLASLFKFVKCYFQELFTNPKISQSDMVLDFLEITSLYRAVSQGCMEHLEFLVTNGQDLCKYQDDHGRTPLHIAVLQEQAHLIEYLAQHKCQINATDKNGDTPLHLSMSIQNRTVTQKLLDLGADVHILNKKKQSTLELACIEGRADMACHLIGQHGCSVKNKDGKSLLYYAIISKKAPIEQKEDLVEYLIAEGADRNFKDKHGNNLVLLAVEDGLSRAANLLLKRGVDGAEKCNKEKNSLLHAAARNGNHKLIADMLKSPVIQNFGLLNAEGLIPIAIAAQGGHHKVVRLLASHSDLTFKTKKGQTLLHLAAAKGHHKVVMVLRPYQMDLDARDSEGKSAMLLASESSHTQVVQVLINLGANPYIADNKGRTALHHAALHGNLTMAIHLLSSKEAKGLGPAPSLARKVTTRPTESLVNIIDTEGNTPLHIAIWVLSDHTYTSKEKADRHHIVRLLVEEGSNVHAADGYNALTPLHLAASHCNIGIVEFLLRHGADPNREQGDGETALHMATKRGNVGVVSVLLEAGADANRPSKADGKPPLYHSRERGFHHLTQYLIEHGALDTSNSQLSAESLALPPSSPTEFSLGGAGGGGGSAASTPTNNNSITSNNINNNTNNNISTPTTHVNSIIAQSIASKKRIPQLDLTDSIDPNALLCSYQELDKTARIAISGLKTYTQLRDRIALAFSLPKGWQFDIWYMVANGGCYPFTIQNSISEVKAFAHSLYITTLL